MTTITPPQAAKGDARGISIPSSYWRFFILSFYAAAFCFLLYHAYLLISYSHPPDLWRIGDWLINYRGGLVRRGFLGELFFWAGYLSGAGQLVAAIVAFQLLLYSLFFTSACRLSLRSPFSATSAALICSPAFILFPDLDPSGAYRKEILLFALLSTLCGLLSAPRARVSRNLPVCVGLAAVVIVLSHELMAVFLPYVVCAFILHEKGVGIKARQAALSLVPAIIVAGFIMGFARGDRQVVIDVCASLKGSGPEDCTHPAMVGAIAFLGKDIAFAFDLVRRSVSATTLVVYAAVSILSLVPVVLALHAKPSASVPGDRGMRWGVAACVMLAMIGSVPFLFVVADYGRLIYIHATCLSLLTLMAIQEGETVADLQLTPNGILAWGSVVAFVISWRIVHWNASGEGAFPLLAPLFGYFLHG